MGIWWVLNNWVIPNYSEIVKEKSTKLKWKRQARINQHYQLPSYDLKKELEKSEEKLMILFYLIIFIFIYYSLFIKCYWYYYNNPLLVIFLGLVVYTGHDSKLMQVMSLICLYDWVRGLDWKIFGSWSWYMGQVHWGPYFLTESQMYSCLAQPNSVSKHVILWLLVYLFPPLFLCLTRLALCMPSFAAFEQGFFCVVSWQKHTHNCIVHLTIYDNILVALLVNKNGRN